MSKDKITDMVDGEVEDNLEGVNQEVEEDGLAPSMSDPNWTEWFISQLEDSEIANGNPKVPGIRRVATSLGLIVESHSSVVSYEPYKFAAVSHTMSFVDESNNLRSVTSVVDVLYDKTPAPFKEHLLGTADTRAEGKALRRVLCLNIVTDEEIQLNSEDEIEGEGQIEEHQKMAITVMCTRMGIDVKKLLTKEYSIDDIDLLTKGQAITLSTRLSGYQRKTSDIPDEVKS